MITLFGTIACTLVGWAGITIGVPVKLLYSQSNQLPDKTIETTHKQLKFKENALTTLTVTLDSLTSIVAENAGQCRTFAVRVNAQCSGMTITDFDPLAPLPRNVQVMGVHVVEHSHFFIMIDNGNKTLLETSFKKTGKKIKYVREFEFVDEDCAPIATNVEAVIDDQGITLVHQLVDGIDLQDTSH